VTLAYVRTPLLLYRDAPARAAHARNFVQLAPVSVNRSGRHDYFLWLGSWATMQTADAAEHRDSFRSIVIFADTEPLLLDAIGWTPEVTGASETTYHAAVPAALDAYYSVTPDQIELIAAAEDLRLQTRGTPVRVYTPWRSQDAARQGLIEFVNRGEPTG
jgi:hypothetical protein